MSNLRIEAFIPPKISTADHSRRERAIEMKKHRQRLGFFRYISFLYTVMVPVVGLEIGIASWNAPPEKVLIYAGFRGFEDEKIFEFSPSVLPIFQSGLGEHTTWRVVRVVEGATLEKSCAARHLGFESLTLRQPEKPVLPASLFYSRFPIPKPASIASAEITFELYSRCA